MTLHLVLDRVFQLTIMAFEIYISFSGLIGYTDCGSNRCNSGGPSDFSYSSGRSGHAVPTFGLSTDLSGLTKVSSSPGTVTSHQRQSTSKSDRNIESVQVGRQTEFQ